MTRVIVRYTVKPGQEGVNEKPVPVVYDELHQTQPTGLRYATFRLDDGRTFAHVAVDETLHQRNPLLEVAAFRRFTDGIAGRCEIPRRPPRRARSAAIASRAWADGDGEAFAAWYAPDATVILPGVYLPGQDAIREAMAAAFAGPLKNTRRNHQVCSIRFTSPGTAIVITDSVTVPPGEPQPAAQQRERATWALSRSDGRWLIHAYHSSPGGEDVD
jgi:uncharacterized protein (TIGR02246 family)